MGLWGSYLLSDNFITGQYHKNFSRSGPLSVFTPADKFSVNTNFRYYIDAWAIELIETSLSLSLKIKTKCYNL